MHPVAKVVSAYWRLLRPRHWIKNVFVLVGLVFGHAWGNTSLVYSVLLAFIAFSFASSAIYILNDYFDRDSDQHHPHKAMRPIANGDVNLTIALVIAAMCLVAALSVAAVVSSALVLIVVTYLAVNVCYTVKLKYIPILDVFSISLGFVLRLLAGTSCVGIEPSGWLILCGMLITLFLGFSKRRTESVMLSEFAGEHRKVLDQYHGELLNHLVSICAGATIVTYSLYTVSPHVIELHGTTDLAYSIPFAVYGILHHVYQLFRNQGKGDLAEDFFADRHLIFTTVGWCVAVVWALA
jgi:hypothetical protein